MLFLFLDGVGIGKKNAAINPFFATKLTAFTEILGGTMLSLRDAHRLNSGSSHVPIDATLGIGGLPQSGTGQTSLMTGVNAPRDLGKHFGPYPYSTQRILLETKNLFRLLQGQGKNVFYANAFPRQFFSHLQVSKTRISAITMAWIASGFALNDHDALSSGKALSSDITGERWKLLGYPDMEVLSAEHAGRRLAEFTKEYEFVLFEYYLTDHAGHSQSMEEAEAVLQKLDGLLSGILEALDHKNTLLIITSDHGNLEDLSTKSHTRNPVPLLCVGHRHRSLTERVKNLAHVAPAIIELVR